VARRADSLRAIARDRDRSRARGFVYGLDRFGASAPYTDLAEFFGFTPDRVCARVLEHLRPPGEGARSPSE
jgi:transketolase